MSLIASPASDLYMHNENTIITVAAVKSMATLIKGKLGGASVELMLDSGSSVSLVQIDALKGACNVVQVSSARQIQLVTASGDRLPIIKHVKAPVQLSELLHCNGYQHKRWKVCCVDGLWLYRNTILQLFTVKDLRTVMLMHFPALQPHHVLLP